ncbi:Flagellar hook-length control protein [Enterobacter sp. DC4]|uniref:flagellar hook-length control protein FliK n=1 Tax=Enterobacter sp. DC4 TaxID=1395580 RepID=UPI0003ED1092|nr:flagellar hook-length control protein FliK [Enterobacter sp. DC4]EWG67266.1 Flagellar hook-length control protein [Enterobacter sp. DC4]
MIVRTLPVTPGETGRQAVAQPDGDERFAAELDKKRQPDFPPSAQPATQNTLPGKTAQNGDKPASDKKETELPVNGLAVGLFPLVQTVADTPPDALSTDVAAGAIHHASRLSPVLSDVPTAAEGGGTARQETVATTALAGEKDMSAVLAPLMQAQKDSVTDKPQSVHLAVQDSLQATKHEQGAISLIPMKPSAEQSAKATDIMATRLSVARESVGQSQPDQPQQPAHFTPMADVSTPVQVSSTPVHTPPTVSLTTPAPLITTGVLNADVGTPVWQQSLGQQVACFTRDGVHHAELRLHPEELGALQISLRLNNDQAQLHFVTDNHQVRAALESAMPHLRTSLAESGIQLGQSSIGSDGAASWGSSYSGQGQGGGSSQGMTEEGGGESTVEETDNILRTISYSSGINTFV